VLKRIALVGAAVLTTLLALLLLWQFRIVVIYVMVSLALAAALRPLVSRLVAGRRLVRAAWMVLYLAGLISFGALLFLTGEAAMLEIQLFSQTVSTQDAWRLPVWLQGSPFQLFVVAQLPPPSKLFVAFTGDQGQLVLPAIIGISQGLEEFISGFLVILFLSIYWSINQIHFERLWLSLLPSDQRKQARNIWRTIEVELGAYQRSEFVQSLLAGILLGLGYWLIGSPYPALLALIGAMAWLIPVAGAFMALILPFSLGLITSVQLSLLTTLYTLFVLIALQVWVEPRLFRRRWDNPILTLIVLLAMADAFGLIGLLVAPPISAICQILWNRLFSNRAVSGAAAQISDLKERQARAWDNIKAMEEPPIALVSIGMERLKNLINKAEPILQAGLPDEPSGLPALSASDSSVLPGSIGA